MAIAGTIEQTSAITLPRVLERIFDHEQPCLLRLKHRDSGKTARVKIDRGAVQETVYGELNGDAAMKEISQTWPWEYEFESEDPTITTGRLPVQPISRPAKKPALKLVGAGKPMMLSSGEISAGFAARSAPPAPAVNGTKPEMKSAFMGARAGAQQRPAPAQPGVAATAPVPVEAEKKVPGAPARRMRQWPDAGSLAAWVAESDEYAVRFAKSGEVALGAVAEGEWDYYQADSASLMLWATGIGDTLGYSAPILAALVEPLRAASYRRLEDGFAGIYSGPETTVDSIIGIP